MTLRSIKKMKNLYTKTLILILLLFFSHLGIPTERVPGLKLSIEYNVSRFCPLIYISFFGFDYYQNQDKSMNTDKIWN